MLLAGGNLWQGMQCAHSVPAQCRVSPILSPLGIASGGPYDYMNALPAGGCTTEGEHGTRGDI